MNILHIISGDGGGISTFVKTVIANSSDSYKYTVLSFSEFGDEFKKLSEDQGCVLVTMPRPKVNGYRYFLNFLDRFFKENSFNFIHCHIPGIHGAIFKLVSRRFGNTTFAIHSHQTQLKRLSDMNIKDKVINKLNPWINNRISDVKIACGVKAAEYGFGSSSGVNILYNSVNFNKYSKFFGNKSSSDTLRLAHIGRHSIQKNLSFIISFAKYLDREKINFKICMFGSGELSEKFEEEVSVNNLSSSIAIMGRRNNLEDYMRDIDVILLPSYSEGLPTVALESQASCTPMILADTITDEIDLGYGLIKFLPIDDNILNYQSWHQYAVLLKHQNVSNKIDKTQLYNALYEEGFIDTVMVEKYENILSQVI